MNYSEELEEGTLKSASCPGTRCSTPPKSGDEVVKVGRGSTSDLNKKIPTTTFDRISGILASFRDTRKALDESLRKNRELLEYVDGMETPRSKLNFLPSIFGRSIAKRSNVLLPVHQNDLKKTANVANVANGEDRLEEGAGEQLTRITTEDLETISTEIHNLEKRDSWEAKNVKTASPAAKPKPLPHQQQQQQQHRRNNLAKTEDKWESDATTGKTRDYGNFDFCVVDKKRVNVEETRRTPEVTPREVKLPEVTLPEEAYPRRRRATNRFATTTTSSKSITTQKHRDRSEDASVAKSTMTTTRFGACNLCLCSALVSILIISLAVLILLHPAVQLYLRLRTNYIHVFSPPV